MSLRVKPSGKTMRRIIGFGNVVTTGAAHPPRVPAPAAEREEEREPEEEEQEAGRERAAAPDLAARGPSRRPPRAGRQHRCYAFPLVHVR